jgi:hypothetical protein
MKVILVVAVLLFASGAFAHQGHHHYPGSEAVAPPISKESEPAISAIRDDYRRRIEQVFRKGCMDCHSGQTHFPWYYKISGIKQLLDSDIEEARQHLDFSDGYPFKSHAPPIEDLDAIAESVQKGSMPPFLYRLAHKGADLTDEEKSAVLDWSEKSKALLKR